MITYEHYYRLYKKVLFIITPTMGFIIAAR